MFAVIVKYHGATNSRPDRLSARIPMTDVKSRPVGRDYAVNGSDQARTLATALADEYLEGLGRAECVGMAETASDTWTALFKRAG